MGNFLTTGGGSWPRKEYIRRKGMFPKRSRKSASMSVIAAPISEESSMSLPRSICLALPNVVHAEESLFMFHEFRQAIGHDQGKRAQPGGCRRLHPQDTRAAVPGHPSGSGYQSIFLRHGQYQGTLLLGPLQGKGRRHTEGQGYNPDVGSPGPIWSPCRSSIFPSTRGRWWSEEASPA